MGDTTVQFSLLGNDYGTYMILVDGATGDILSTIPVDVTWPTGSDALLKDVTISEYLKTLGSTKGLQIAILDENGDQITDFGGDTSSLATEASLQLLTALIDSGKLKIENDLDISSLATEASLQLITALIDSGSLKVVDSLGATAANQTNGEQKTQIVDSDGNSVEPVENIGITPPSAIVGGVKTLTTAGTAEQLITTSTECQYVVISSLDDNTGLAYIGGSDVDKSTKNGIPIGFVTDSSGVVIPESKIIPIDNANKLYVDVNDDGEGISYVIIT